jgi:hypothetical protein
LRKVEKTALVVAIVLVLFCLASFAVLYFTDFWVAPLKSTAEVAAAGRILMALDQQFPFSPPRGAGIPKERLDPYFTASCRTKSTADAVQKWFEENNQVWVAGQPVYSGEGGALMTAYLKDLTAALQKVKMGPEEFDWIHQRLRLAARGMPSEHRRREMRETLEEIRQASENPQIGAHERDELKRHIADLETLPDAWGAASQADWALYQADAERIKACGHGHRAVRAVSKLLVHASGGQRISVEFDPDDGPPSTRERSALPPPPPPSH